MARQMSLKAKEAFATCRRLERAHVAVFPAVRTAAVMLIIATVAARTGHLTEASSLLLGVLFASIVDLRESERVRIGTMLWASLWYPIVTIIGGLVSDYLPLHVVVAFIIAACTGYAASLGGRGAIVGVLCLVLFALYSGDAIGLDSTLKDAGLVALGALISTGAAAALWPLHRHGSVRACIATAFADLADATSRTGAELANPIVAADILTAQSALDHSYAGGHTRAWLESLLEDIERSRLGLLGLFGVQSTHRAQVAPVTAAGTHLAQQIARSVTWGRAVKALPAAVSALQRTVAETTDPEVHLLAEAFAQPLLHAAAQVGQPTWPIGRHSEGGHTPVAQVSPWTRLRAHAHRGDALLEHAIRQSIAFGGATILAVSLPLGHAYWIPLTVAWITKPDLATTVPRIVMRVAGTLAGILLIGGILLVAPVDTREVVLILTITAGAYLVIAYLWANYIVCVVGITLVIMSLQAIGGNPVLPTLVFRLIATVVAGIWVLLVSLVRPRRAGAAALQAMRDTTASLRHYADAIRSGKDLPHHRNEVLQRRAMAVAAVSAAAIEPRGIFERDPVIVDPHAAAELLADVITVTTELVAEDLLQEQSALDETIWASAHATLEQIDIRIAQLQAG